MINTIVASIATKLDATFDGVPVYTEEIKQGLEEPCFFIKSINPSQTQIVGGRHYRDHLFDVHYFPPLDGKEKEHINDTIPELYEALEYIPFDDKPIRGTEMRGETVDGVLHFMVRYAFTVYRAPTPEELMTSVTVDSHV